MASTAKTSNTGVASGSATAVKGNTKTAAPGVKAKTQTAAKSNAKASTGRTVNGGGAIMNQIRQASPSLKMEKLPDLNPGSVKVEKQPYRNTGTAPKVVQASRSLNKAPTKSNTGTAVARKLGE